MIQLTYLQSLQTEIQKVQHFLLQENHLDRRPTTAESQTQTPNPCSMESSQATLDFASTSCHDNGTLAQRRRRMLHQWLTDLLAMD